MYTQRVFSSMALSMSSGSLPMTHYHRRQHLVARPREFKSHFHLNVKLFHVHAKLIVGSAVQPRSTDEVLTWFTALSQGHELLAIS